MAEKSLRETLEQNFTEDLDPPEAPEVQATGVEPPSEPPVAAGKPEGEPPKVPEQPQEPPIQEPPPDGGQPQRPPEREGISPEQQAPSIRAPHSWRPEVREHWAKLPPEVQQEVVRREQQVSRALNEASRYAQHYQQFNEVCAPYSSMIAMDGGSPLNTFKEYLQTAAILRLGAPQEKATAIANAIMQFGVDVQQLDTALVQRMGGQPGQPAPQQQQQFRDPRLDQLLGNMELRRRERDEQLTYSQQQEIDAFSSDPKNEFFEDLRPMVADILEVYANQGVRCSLKEAYDKACLMHPEVSKIVQARNTATAANNLVKRNNQTLAAKRRAASLPPGSPNIGPEDNGDMSLRDTIAAAVSQVESHA